MARTKDCSVCRLNKPLAEFYERKEAPGTYKARCRDCTRARVSMNYHRKREASDCGQWALTDYAPAHRAWQAVDRRMSSTPAANGPRYLIGAMG